MKKLSIKNMLLGTGALAIVLSGGAALALTDDSGQHDANTTQPQEHATSQLHEKLAQDKLKICKAREHGIDTMMSRMANRGTKQISIFNQVAERVESFYVKKGNTLTNYDALVADVNAKKATATTAVNDVKDASTSFKCDGSDPKGAAEAYKAKVQTMNSALKDYKNSVKALIQGVRSVNSKTEGTSND